MDESKEDMIRRIVREEMKMKEQKEEEKKKKKQVQDDGQEIPPIKIGETVITCDWRTKQCKILKSDGTPVEVGSNENWEGVLNGDTIKSVRKNKSGNNME